MYTIIPGVATSPGPDVWRLQEQQVGFATEWVTPEWFRRFCDCFRSWAVRAGRVAFLSTTARVPRVQTWCVGISFARGGWRRTVAQGPESSVLHGPILAEVAYPQVLVARAFSRGDDLHLVLYPGAGEGLQSIGIERLKPLATIAWSERKGVCRFALAVKGGCRCRSSCKGAVNCICIPDI